MESGRHLGHVTRRCQVTSRDRGARRHPPLKVQGVEERSLGEGTAGELCHLGRSQAKWLGLADDPAHRSPLQVALSNIWTPEGSAHIHGRGL